MAWHRLLLPVLAIALSAPASARTHLPGPGFAPASMAAVSGDEIFPNSFEAPFTLTINNDVAWCNVTIDGGTPDSSLTITVPIFPGIVAQLHADPLLGFIWGFWSGTDDGDNFTMQDTTVTMTSDRSVEVCCPIPPAQGGIRTAVSDATVATAASDRANYSAGNA
jgi:hypothetical protein